MDRADVRTRDPGRERAALRAGRAGIDCYRFPAPGAAEAVAAAPAPALLAGTPGKRGGQHSSWHPGAHRGAGPKRLAQVNLLTLAEAGGVVVKTAPPLRKLGPRGVCTKDAGFPLARNDDKGGATPGSFLLPTRS